jgi:uncharacterized membrane protein YeiH
MDKSCAKQGEMSMIYLLDMLGTAVFAMTGSLVARKKQMDIFGVIVIALVTAMGGGTLRELILGTTPVFWVRDPNYVIVALIGVALTILLVRLNLMPQRPLLLADALGLALFTVIGTQAALSANVAWGIAIMLGTMGSVAGGIIRDILSDEIPLILRKEIYATASILGAATYIAASYLQISPTLASLLAAFVTLSLRLLAIWREWSLPIRLIGFGEDNSTLTGL